MDQNAETRIKQRRELMNSLSMISHMGIAVVVCIFIGVGLGRWLDRMLGTSPWLLLLFSLLGVGAAFKFLYDTLKRSVL